MKNSPGYKTSEFWLSLLSSAGLIATSVFGVPIPMETVITVGGTVISYVLGRNNLKKGGKK